MDNSRDSLTSDRPTNDTQPPSYEEATGSASLARTLQLVRAQRGTRADQDAYAEYEALVARGLERFLPNIFSAAQDPPTPPSPSSSSASASSVPPLVPLTPTSSPGRASIVARLADLQLVVSPAHRLAPPQIPSGQATAGSSPQGATYQSPRVRNTSPRLASPPPGDDTISEEYIRREQISRILFAAVLSVKEQNPLTNPDQLWLNFIAKLTGTNIFEDEEDIRSAWESVFREEPRLLFGDLVFGDLESVLLKVWSFLLPA